MEKKGHDDYMQSLFDLDEDEEKTKAESIRASIEY